MPFSNSRMGFSFSALVFYFNTFLPYLYHSRCMHFLCVVPVLIWSNFLRWTQLFYGDVEGSSHTLKGSSEEFPLVVDQVGFIIL